MFVSAFLSLDFSDLCVNTKYADLLFMSLEIFNEGPKTFLMYMGLLSYDSVKDEHDQYSYIEIFTCFQV